MDIDLFSIQLNNSLEMFAKHRLDIFTEDHLTIHFLLTAISNALYIQFILM